LLVETARLDVLAYDTAQVTPYEPEFGDEA
jgi:hypothetical protein